MKTPSLFCKVLLCCSLVIASILSRDVVAYTANSYMDNLKQEFQKYFVKEIAQHKVKIMPFKTQLFLTIPGEITFRNISPLDKDFMDKMLKSDFRKILNSLAVVLHKFDKTIIQIVSYALRVGEGMSYREVADIRADSVTKYLIGKGIKPERISTFGQGLAPKTNQTRFYREMLSRKIKIIIGQST